jgi:hypothetical protein
VSLVVGIGSEAALVYYDDANEAAHEQRKHHMNTADALKRIIAGALLSGGLGLAGLGLAGLGLAGLGLAAGTAQAYPAPVPLNAWPGCPNDHPAGPCHWCPGDPPVQTGNLRVNPVVWDSNVCHTYWYVPFGQGNVAQDIFEGDSPPPPPPPPPPGLNFCPGPAILCVFAPGGVPPR